MIYGARVFVGRVNCSPSLFDNDRGRCERNHSVSTFTFRYFHDHLGPTWGVDCKVVDDSERLGRGSIVQPNKSQKQFPGINAQLHTAPLLHSMHSAQLHTAPVQQTKQKRLLCCDQGQALYNAEHVEL